MPLKAGIYYSSSGDRKVGCPPVVLIHGAGSNHLVWASELRRLTGFRSLAIDLPGHGRSEGAARQTIEAYAESVTHFLSAFDIYQAILIGHSMGGAVALQIALSEPNRVAALGLIASGAYLAVPRELMEALSNPAMMPLALQWLRQRLFGPEVSDDLARRTVEGLKAARPGVLSNDWQACARFDVRSQVGQLRPPLWLAAGVEDHLLPLSSVHFLAAQAPDARLHLVPNAGHMLILERPRLLAQGLEAFLKQYIFC